MVRRVAIATLVLGDPNETDSWGVVGGLCGSFLALVFAAVLIAPAILMWAPGQRGLLSVVLGLVWGLAVHTAFVVPSDLA